MHVSWVWWETCAKINPLSTFNLSKLLSNPTYQLKANTVRSSFANQEFFSLLVEPSSWDHEPSSPLWSTKVSTNVDVLGTHVGTHVDDVEPIDGLSWINDLEFSNCQPSCGIAKKHGWNKIYGIMSIWQREKCCWCYKLHINGTCPVTCPCRFVCKINHTHTHTHTHTY